MLLTRVLAIMLFVCSSVACASSLVVDVSNNAAQVVGGYSSDGNGELQAGVLYNNQGSVMVDGGLALKGGEEGSTGPNGGGAIKVLGAKLLQNGVSNNVFCLALGGLVSFTPPTAPNAAIVADFLSSLQITTFGSADHFSQFSVRLEIGPPHAKYFIGYREISFNIISVGSYSVDKGGYTGVSFTF